QDDRCPELAGACKRAAGGDIKWERRERRDQSTTITFPAATGTVRLLRWLVGDLLTAYIIYLIAKHTLKQRPSADDEDAITVATADGEDPGAGARRLGETAVQPLA